MKIIEIKKKKYVFRMEKAEDITFVLENNKNIGSEIFIDILFSDSQEKIDLNFIAAKGSFTNIKIVTKVPQESINNDIEIHLNGLITSEDSRIVFEPSFELYNNSSKIVHSTTIGTINKKWHNYLGSRGLSEQNIIDLFNSSYDVKNK